MKTRVVLLSDRALDLIAALARSEGVDSRGWLGRRERGDGMWDVTVNERSYLRVEQNRLPGETFSQAVERIMALALTMPPAHSQPWDGTRRRG